MSDRSDRLVVAVVGFLFLARWWPSCLSGCRRVRYGSRPTTTCSVRPSSAGGPRAAGSHLR